MTFKWTQALLSSEAVLYTVTVLSHDPLNLTTGPVVLSFPVDLYSVLEGESVDVRISVTNSGSDDVTVNGQIVVPGEI